MTKIIPRFYCDHRFFSYDYKVYDIEGTIVAVLRGGGNGVYDLYIPDSHFAHPLHNSFEESKKLAQYALKTAGFVTIKPDHFALLNCSIPEKEYWPFYDPKEDEY